MVIRDLEKVKHTHTYKDQNNSSKSHWEITFVNSLFSLLFQPFSAFTFLLHLQSSDYTAKGSTLYPTISIHSLLPGFHKFKLFKVIFLMIRQYFTLWLYHYLFFFLIPLPLEPFPYCKFLAVLIYLFEIYILPFWGVILSVILSKSG